MLRVRLGVQNMGFATRGHAIVTKDTKGVHVQLPSAKRSASQGIVKWAMASFVGGVAIVVGLHPLYSRIRQEQLRKSRYGGAGPMIDMQHRYR